MKTKTFLFLALLCMVAQGAWATDVATAQQLRDAISDGANITLTADITVESHLTISGSTTIDLNSHTLHGNTTATTSTSSFTCPFAS